MKQSSEPVFCGNDFCQWLIEHDYMANESMARAYIQQIETNQQIVCLNRNQNSDDVSDLLTNWYAFSK